MDSKSELRLRHKIKHSLIRKAEVAVSVLAGMIFDTHTFAHQVFKGWGRPARSSVGRVQRGLSR